jgi:N-acetylmuramoyl-L-alanine amidase
MNDFTSAEATPKLRTVHALSFSFRFILLSLLIALAALVFCRLFTYFNGSDSTVSGILAVNAVSNANKTVIIDAGHGGVDGGAVGINNVLEKDLTLDIAQILNELFTSAGYDVIMSRTDDRMLYDDSANGKRKMQDLKNRVLLAKENPDSVFVSIHMNSFPQEKYSGTQIYYSPNTPESGDMAQIIREYVRNYIQPDNNRETKKAGSQIYVMDKISVPAVLIECGFISNYGEAERLCDSVYRHELSFVIFCALNDYLTVGSEIIIQ